MITLGELLKRIRASFPGIELHFLHPTLYIVWKDNSHIGKAEEVRFEEFARKLDLNIGDLEAAITASGSVLVLTTNEEFDSDYAFLAFAPTTSHWLELLAGVKEHEGKKPPIFLIHFYGYKGGQGRSTVLAMLSQSLADDGYRVLAIDADIEAPSLQTIFDGAATTLSSTLFGCASYGLESQPVTVYVPKTGMGRIDMLACRPNDKDYDLDAANFALRTTLDPEPVQAAIGEILEKGKDDYDIAFIDHRTGLSNSSIPLMATYPGPVVICLRLDDQSDRAESYFDVLFKLHPENPGLFVSFTLDPEEGANDMINRHQDKIIGLLQSISDSLALAKPDDDSGVSEVPEADDLLNYWVPWFHDRNFFGKHLPSVAQILSSNKKSLLGIRDILGVSASIIDTAPPAVIPPPTGAVELSGSGNKDYGPLIEADALRQLRAPSTPFVYILGRKGTGKTRLLRALAEEKKGDPLLVADDYPHPQGVLSNDTLLADLATNCIGEPIKLWWILVDSALVDNERGNQQARLRELLAKIKRDGLGSISITEIRDRVVSVPKRRVMLIDGVETAFSASQTSQYVEGLFRFLSTLQSDTALANKLVIRLFIRTDLVEGARENIEQQLENRTIRLAWDTESILNFVIARIGSISWFRTEFDMVTKEIDRLMPQLIQGAVKEDQCGTLLLQIFPDKIRRNNLGTLTFLKNYFSDGQGERASFYPRVYDSFLRFIASGGPLGNTNPKKRIENGRVAQDLIFEAHANACKDYLSQVKDELRNMLEFSGDPVTNSARISELLDGFNGMLTPFDLDETIGKLGAKIAPKIDESSLRKALLQMKKVGIFEDRTDYPGQWRVGRLFKSSLGMRYNRRRKDDGSDIDI